MAGAAPRVYWLVQTVADVPLDEEWLASAERHTCASLRTPRRRCDWRLGRWTIKRAVAQVMIGRGTPVRRPADIVVCSHPNGAPYCRMDGCEAPCSLSLSHRNGRALCVIAPQAAAVGCDLEHVEARDDAFTREWFTPPEQDAIARTSEHDRDQLITLLWSAKESALKAVGAGLTVPTDLVTVTIDNQARDGDWRSLRVIRHDTAELMRGWWRTDGTDVITVIAALPSVQAPPSNIHLLEN